MTSPKPDAGPSRRRLLTGLALAVPSLSLAQGGRPVRLVVPFAAGGGSDNVARSIAGPMGAALGQTVVIDNRAGAGGSIGAAEVARADPDGATLLLDAASHLIVPLLLRDPPVRYEVAFTPVTRVALLPQLLVVRAGAPDRLLREFLDRARARPGALTFAVPGNGTQQHLAGTALFRRAGVDVLGVPYRGAAAAIQAVLAGEADCAINLTVAMGGVRDGALRALAVTSAVRLPQLPDVPTIGESGFPGYDMSEWSGIWGPAGLAPGTVLRVQAAVAAALSDATARNRLATMGAVPVGNAAESFKTELAQERSVFAALVRDARITLD